MNYDPTTWAYRRQRRSEKRIRVCSEYFILAVALVIGMTLLAKSAQGEIAPVSVSVPQKVTKTTPTPKVAPAASSALTAPSKQGSQGVASWLLYTLPDSCAARDWPVGTRLEVSYQGKSITCVRRDYGPDPSIFPERIVDLNAALFAKLAPLSQGIIHVTVTPL